MEERVQQLEQLLHEAADLLDDVYQYDELSMTTYQQWRSQVRLAFSEQQQPSPGIPFVLTTEGAKILRGETESS